VCVCGVCAGTGIGSRYRCEQPRRQRVREMSSPAPLLQELHRTVSCPAESCETRSRRVAKTRRELRRLMGAALNLGKCGESNGSDLG
jgi:hypothetical protein